MNESHSFINSIKLRIFNRLGKNAECAHVKTIRYAYDSQFIVFERVPIFWVITPCSLLSVNRRFGETYRLHLQSKKIILHSV
jgi:hypothetical protein